MGEVPETRQSLRASNDPKHKVSVKMLVLEVVVFDQKNGELTEITQCFFWFRPASWAGALVVSSTPCAKKTCMSTVEGLSQKQSEAAKRIPKSH